MVEHRLAWLNQLRIRQAHYFGHIKTQFQLFLASIVANLALLAAKAGLTEEPGSGTSAGSTLAAGASNSAANSGAGWLGGIWTLTLLPSDALTISFFSKRGFIRVSRQGWRGSPL